MKNETIRGESFKNFHTIVSFIYLQNIQYIWRIKIFYNYQLNNYDLFD